MKFRKILHPRFVVAPILATILALWFWRNYYSHIKWWPIVLFVIFAVHYAVYQIKEYKRV